MLAIDTSYTCVFSSALFRHSRGHSNPVTAGGLRRPATQHAFLFRDGCCRENYWTGRVRAIIFYPADKLLTITASSKAETISSSASVFSRSYPPARPWPSDSNSSFRLRKSLCYRPTATAAAAAAPPARSASWSSLPLRSTPEIRKGPNRSPAMLLLSGGGGGVPHFHGNLDDEGSFPPIRAWKTLRSCS